MRAGSTGVATVAACILSWASCAQAASSNQPMSHDAHDHSHHHHMMMPSPNDPPVVLENTPGNASPPQIPTDHAADAFFPPDRMAAARDLLAREGRMTYSQVMIERLEVRSRRSRDEFTWEGEASFGADIDRFVLATQGEGAFGGKLEKAEVHAKWRRAVDPWFNAELGLRQDLTGPSRTYLSAGVAGLLPYWVEAEAQVFVSNRGDVHARVEFEVDQRITQRLVLQPSAEIELAFQDVAELGITSPVPEWALGARLRYEIQPYFAPYVGIERRRDYSLPSASNRSQIHKDVGTNLLVGLQAWF